MAAFQSVVWTAGDVVTEAKLDAMTSNAQSEDAHAANGYIANNNVAYSGKQAGAAVKELMKLATDDFLRLSQIPLQANTSNSTVENQLIQQGWGFTIPNSEKTKEETVTFPETYSSVAPIVYISFIGADTGGGATSPDDFTTAATMREYAARSITTSNFIVHLYHTNDTAFGNGTAEYGYSWMAIGTKA